MFQTNSQTIKSNPNPTSSSYNLLNSKNSIIPSIDQNITFEVFNQKLSASIDTSCYIEPRKSKLYCWGQNPNGILDIPIVFNSKTIFVQTGPVHACAMAYVKAKDNQNKPDYYGAMCWGQNITGGTDIQSKYLYEDFGIGMGFTCGLIVGELGIINKKDYSENKLVCYGSYILINQNIDMHSYDIIIPDLFNKEIQYFITGFSHVLIHKKTLYCIGLNKYGECNIPKDKFEYNYVNSRRNSDSSYSSDISSSSSTSSDNDDMNNINANDLSYYMHASAGYCHSCAITNSNLMICWGKSDHGQTVRPTLHRPVYYGVYGGFAHNCAVTVNGIFCWGENSSHQAAGYMYHPRDLKQISVGAYHNCILNGDGEHVNKFDHIYCWGNNKENQCVIPIGLNVYKA